MACTNLNGASCYIAWSYRWWQLRLTCAQPVLGFAHDALFNRCTDAPETGWKPEACTEDVPSGSRKISASCRVSKPISTMSRLLASGVVVELRQDMDQHQRMDVTPDASGTG